MFNALGQAAWLDEREVRVSPVPTDTDEALAGWRGTALNDRTTLAGYLTARHLTPDGLEAVLTGSPWTLREADGIPWMNRVAEYLVDPSASRLELELPTLVVESTQLDRLPFDGLFVGVLDKQDTWLGRWDWLEKNARSDLLGALATQLVTTSIRCLIDDLAETRGEPVTRTPAPTSAYENLSHGFAEPEHRRTFYARYPTLARDLVRLIDTWHDHVTALLERLETDERQLHSAGLITTPVRTLTGVRLYAGDKHDNGQAVTLLTFAQGERLVYKPRDCQVFALYDRLSHILNGELAREAQIVAPRHVVAEGYGWVEYISHGQRSISLTGHLRQIGSLLALAHILGASDLHFENVISSDRGPVAIDLETMFQNRSRRLTTQNSLRTAVSILNETVLGPGILPMRLKNGQDSALDVSVLTGSLDIGEATLDVACINQPFTDDMAIALRTLLIGSQANQPPGMSAAFVRDHRSEIVQAFTVAYRAAIRRRSDLVAEIQSATDLEVRQLERPTRAYSLLLAESRQPSRLRSGLHREHLMRSLWANRDSSEELAISHEEEISLRGLDIPLFTTTAKSRDLLVRGKVVVHDYFTSTLAADLERRIGSLDEQRLDDAAQLIDEAVCAAVPARAADVTEADLIVAGWPSDLESNVQAARQLAVTLTRTAVQGAEDITWIGMVSSEDSTGLEYRPIGPTLYDGLAGISLAAAYAHTVIPDLELDDVAVRSTHAVAAVLEDWCDDKVRLPIGAYSGASGLVYALHHVDAALGHDRYATLCADAITRIADSVAEDDYLDITAGAAGACAVLARCFSSPAADDAVARLAAHIIDRSAVLDGGRRVWELGDAGIRLGGFSHGATGIGWALSLAAHRLDDAALRTAALEAFAYDDSLYDSEKRGWLDLRPESLASGRYYPNQWCHGGAGIAMARRHAAGVLGADELLQLAEHGRSATISAEVDVDDSLCHGALGNWLTTRVCDDEASVLDSAHLQTAVVSRIQRRGFLNGLPQGIRSVPGLMLGTAGALYALCAAEAPSIPNVLLLEGPNHRG